jgi:hypothetical protein
MKNLLLIFLSLISLNTGIYGQSVDTFERTRFAIECNQFITGSGFRSGTEIYCTVIPDKKKNISLGLYFCPMEKAISGITIHHERSIIRSTSERRVHPYVFYNMIYRITQIKEKDAECDTMLAPGTYKSLEHHLGVGARMVIAKDVFFNCSLGYGIYLGSIRKPTASISCSEELMGGNGFGVIAKVGFAFVL